MRAHATLKVTQLKNPHTHHRKKEQRNKQRRTQKAEHSKPELFHFQVHEFNHDSTTVSKAIRYCVIAYLIDKILRSKTGCNTWSFIKIKTGELSSENLENKPRCTRCPIPQNLIVRSSYKRRHDVYTTTKGDGNRPSLLCITMRLAIFSSGENPNCKTSNKHPPLRFLTYQPKHLWCMNEILQAEFEC